MKQVFVDTSFFVALSNPRDQYHQRASHLNDVFAASVVTTSWVLLEFANRAF
jgi:predicted nucleic acid-binding protein